MSDCHCDRCYEKTKRIKRRPCDCERCYEKTKRITRGPCGCDYCYEKKRQENHDCQCNKCRKPCRYICEEEIECCKRCCVQRHSCFHEEHVNDKVSNTSSEPCKPENKNEKIIVIVT
jgi:hypothetical protein